MDSEKHRECEGYREMAAAIRSLIPKMKYREVADELRLLAVRYERLAEYQDTAPYFDKTSKRLTRDER